MTQTQKKETMNLSETLKQCHISASKVTPLGTVLGNVLDPELLTKWPKLKMTVPTIFLHKPSDLAQHIKKILSMGIKIYQPHLGVHFTKISCCTFNDHRSLVKYFEKKQLSYHTFGHPSKRKMKVVIRGLPIDVDVDQVKEELISLSIPIIRLHIMHKPIFSSYLYSLALAVVPCNDNGKKILKIKRIMGYDVKFEPLLSKIRQCYRCQKWGHSQRYCHGQIKCVKCAGEHSYKKCLRDPKTEPPKCANCNGEHTANYRKCPFCPDSTAYKLCQLVKETMNKSSENKTKELVTINNYQYLYRNVEYEKK